MNFVDTAVVKVVAGKGGDGKLSFRREKFIAKGGPNGGDGGDGGDIVLVASRNQNTLAAFRHQKEMRAEAGEPGDRNNRHGKNGKDLLLAVPVGTIASDTDGNVMADLTEDGQKAVVAQGGRGGFGNAHFTSSRRQTPAFAEKGEPGDQAELRLELKMIADVGLVGLPNAGKSTLLSKVSNARPEIADYPFTTLRPNLGVVDVDDSTSVLLADIPGLIEGASAGKGLGHDFLRHVERTAVILHLIDAYTEDVADAYRTVRDELKAYRSELGKRPQIIVLSKVEGLDEEIVADLAAQLKKAAPKGTPVLAVSSFSGQGLRELLFTLKDAVTTARTKAAKAAAKQPDTAVPVLTLSDTSDSWRVVRKGKHFVVTGQRIEQFARRTDFGNDEAVQRLRHIMGKMGILHELRRRGVEAGQSIRIGSSENDGFDY
ncbi:MAG TPA: GTPase ObgE [Verrucomicrobiae bacterium]|nr:GTPase ObgE [Verrucomicrobiae bacterium]